MADDINCWLLDFPYVNMSDKLSKSLLKRSTLTIAAPLDGDYIRRCVINCLM